MSESCFRRPELNVVVIGLDNAGKSAVVERLKASYPSSRTGKKAQAVAFEKLQATMGMNLAKLEMCGCRVSFWDVGGHRKVRGLWENYYGDAHAWIFVVDASDADRIREARDEFAKACDHPDLQLIPCLVMANKQDRIENNGGDRVLSAADLTARFNIDDRDMQIIVAAASALHMDGVTDAVDALVDLARTSQAQADADSALGSSQHPQGIDEEEKQGFLLPSPILPSPKSPSFTQ